MKEEWSKRYQTSLMVNTVAEKICLVNLKTIKQSFFRKIINKIKYIIYKVKDFIEYIKNYDTSN